jgi:hypothetical protein
MRHKYVRFEDYGFILWPYSDTIIHSDMGRMSFKKVISAGFVQFHNGIPHCTGRSESLGIGGQPDDDAALRAQLGF